MNKTIYKIANRKTGAIESVYSRANHNETEFGSIDYALSAHFSGMHKNKAKYKIQKYKVTYELIDDDCLPPTEEELQEEQMCNREREEDLKRAMKEYPNDPIGQMASMIDQGIVRSMVKGTKEPRN